MSIDRGSRLVFMEIGGTKIGKMGGLCSEWKTPDWREQLRLDLKREKEKMTHEKHP